MPSTIRLLCSLILAGYQRCNAPLVHCIRLLSSSSSPSPFSSRCRWGQAVKSHSPMTYRAHPFSFQFTMTLYMHLLFATIENCSTQRLQLGGDKNDQYYGGARPQCLVRVPVHAFVWHVLYTNIMIYVRYYAGCSLCGMRYFSAILQDKSRKCFITEKSTSYISTLRHTRSLFIRRGRAHTHTHPKHTLRRDTNSRRHRPITQPPPPSNIDTRSKELNSN